MQTKAIQFDADKAREQYQEYRKHQHWSAPIDQEIQRIYKLISQGRVVVKALESIVAAGLGDDYLPKLAIMPATATECFLSKIWDGGCRMAARSGYISDAHKRQYFDFPAASFPGITAGGRYTISSMVPPVPLPLRPKRGLENYHILYEAEWRKTVPVDPMLLRRIGQGDTWLVCAAWDLTEVERAVLQSRLNA